MQTTATIETGVDHDTFFLVIFAQDVRINGTVATVIH